MQPEGSTREFPLSTLIALVGESSATGVLEIDALGATGRICCCAGQVNHAEIGDQTAFDALRQLVQADDAAFRFVLGAHHCDQTLQADTPSLILHVRQQELLYRRMRQHIPSLGSILALRAPNGDVEVRLSATLWPALALVDGQRSVAAIAAELGHEPFEVGMLLGQLVERGLATIMPQPAARADATQPADAPAPGVTTGEVAVDAAGDSPIGFFERLLTSRAEPPPPSKPARRRIRLPNLSLS
jgi:uncharacterized protein DUF4388